MLGRESSGINASILLTNDDGVFSPGLLAIKRELEGLCEVLVVAPQREQSCIGKAITAGRVIKVERVKLSDGTVAYSVDGTPADAVLIALNKILERKPTLLVSGINLGPNLGLDDALDSGTLGAAFEAALRGVPSIAVSFCMARRGLDDKVDSEGLAVAAKVARRIVEEVLRRGFPRGVDVLSINVPQGSKLGLTPVRLTRLSTRPYRDLHVEDVEGYRIAAWGLDVYEDDEPSTDVGAVKEGAISITPIKLRLPSRRRGLEWLVQCLQ
ncbi:MAG: 5'/3'-nucleotidase SurE [Thermoprotei archaeon]|nr:MAG: 5'/3'-nucleotidase SurE [Thermoprotei archaeon]